MLFRETLVLAMIAVLHKVSAGDEDALEACNEFFKSDEHFIKRCCDMDNMHHMDMSPHPDKMHEAKKECDLPAPGEKWTCEHSECVMKSMDYLKEGELNYDEMNKGIDKLAEQMESQDNGQPEMIEMMKGMLKECSQENLMRYPDPDVCLVQRFQACVVLLIAQKCPKWKTDDDTCQKIAENSRLCTAPWTN